MTYRLPFIASVNMQAYDRLLLLKPAPKTVMKEPPAAHPWVGESPSHTSSNWKVGILALPDTMLDPRITRIRAAPAIMVCPQGGAMHDSRVDDETVAFAFKTYAEEAGPNTHVYSPADAFLLKPWPWNVIWKPPLARPLEGENDDHTA